MTSFALLCESPGVITEETSGTVKGSQANIWDPLTVPDVSSVITPGDSHNKANDVIASPIVSSVVVQQDKTDSECYWSKIAKQFKQRSAKLGITQADVSKALQYMKIPGVECKPLTQVTIFRFESNKLLPGNMMFLKPVLSAWLQEAERNNKAVSKKQLYLRDAGKKLNRTTFRDTDKLSLENHFKKQSHPPSEDILDIAKDLELSPDIVRTWFNNRRKKEKAKYKRKNNREGE